MVLESRHDLPSVVFDTGGLKQDMLSDLTLVHGVGGVSEQRLKVRGYRRLQSCRAPEIPVRCPGSP